MCEFKMKGSHFGTPHHNSIKQKAQTIGLGFLRLEIFYLASGCRDIHIFFTLL
jgi:hypothetical protein